VPTNIALGVLPAWRKNRLLIGDVFLGAFSNAALAAVVPL